MARKRKKAKRRIPPNRGASVRAYNDFKAALKNLYSLFETFGEAQALMRDQMEKGFADARTDIRALDQRVEALEVKVAKLSEDMAYIKQEIRLIRHELTQKVNREEFDMLEGRVTRLEKELAVR